MGTEIGSRDSTTSGKTAPSSPTTSPAGIRKKTDAYFLKKRRLQLFINASILITRTYDTGAGIPPVLTSKHNN